MFRIRCWSAAIIVVLVPTAMIRAADPVEFTLDNGLRVRIVPSEKEKRIAVILGVRAGFMEEPKGVPHLAHVTEHMTVYDLKDKELAKTVSAWFSKQKAFAETLADMMYFDLYPDGDEVETAVKIQAARMTAVEFTRDTLAREVPMTLAEIDYVEKSEKASPAKFALGPWVQAAYHGKKDVPMKAMTKEITLDQVREFHSRTFRTDQAMLLVMGKIDPDAVRKVVEKEFGGIKKPAKPPTARTELKAGSAKAEWDVSTRHLMIAWNIPAVKDADHPALTLAATALQFRLSFHADLRPHMRNLFVQNNIDGVLAIGIHLNKDADADKFQARVLELIAESAKEDALKDGQMKFLVSGTKQLWSLPDVNGELQRMFKTLLWGDLDAYVKRMEAVKAEDVRTAITKHLDAKKANVVLIEPVKKN